MAESQEAAVSVCPPPDQPPALTTDIFTALALARVANADAFLRVFGKPLRKYWDHYSGLDTLKLDDEIVKSGDRAMIDVIRERFGEEGVRIINALLLSDKRKKGCR